MLQINDLVVAIGTLPQKDLETLLQSINMRMGTDSKKNFTPEFSNPIETHLFSVIKSELESKGIINKIPYMKLQESKFKKSWDVGVAVVSEFIVNTFGNKHEVEQIALCRIIVRAIISDLLHKEVPISFGSVVRNLQRAPQAFDNAFPGYIASGLAHLIPQALHRRKRQK